MHCLHVHVRVLAAHGYKLDKKVSLEQTYIDCGSTGAFHPSARARALTLIPNKVNNDDDRGGNRHDGRRVRVCARE